MAYGYNDDIFCDACGEAIYLDMIVIDDGGSQDSDEFPQYCDDDAESDVPRHCGSHADCLDPTLLADGSPVGKLIGTNLTIDGIEYLREQIAEGGDVAEMWAQEFVDCL